MYLTFQSQMQRFWNKNVVFIYKITNFRLEENKKQKIEVIKKKKRKENKIKERIIK